MKTEVINASAITNIAAIRAKLMEHGTKFKCFGHTFTINKSEFEESELDTIWSIGRDYKSMNVQKFGPTCVTVYTYDMLGNKTTGKFKYDEIELIDDEVLN